jgi:hypothetical protein
MPNEKMPSKKKVEDLSLEVAALTGLPLPKPIMLFLSTQNGFEFNGFRLFGIHTDEILSGNDFLKNNIYRRESGLLDTLFFLGDSNMDEYYYDNLLGRYQIRDRNSFDVLKEFSSFDTLFEEIRIQAGT